MAERESLSDILLRWTSIEQEWNDRASARLQETCLQPLAEQTKLLEQQNEEISRFLAQMEADLEEILT